MTTDTVFSIWQTRNGPLGRVEHFTERVPTERTAILDHVHRTYCDSDGFLGVVCYPTQPDWQVDDLIDLSYR